MGTLLRRTVRLAATVGAAYVANRAREAVRSVAERPVGSRPVSPRPTPAPVRRDEPVPSVTALPLSPVADQTVRVESPTVVRPAAGPAERVGHAFGPEPVPRVGFMAPAPRAEMPIIFRPGSGSTPEPPPEPGPTRVPEPEPTFTRAGEPVDADEAAAERVVRPEPVEDVDDLDEPVAEPEPASVEEVTAEAEPERAVVEPAPDPAPVVETVVEPVVEPVAEPVVEDPAAWSLPSGVPQPKTEPEPAPVERPTSLLLDAAPVSEPVVAPPVAAPPVVAPPVAAPPVVAPPVAAPPVVAPPVAAPPVAVPPAPVPAAEPAPAAAPEPPAPASDDPADPGRHKRLGGALSGQVTNSYGRGLRFVEVRLIDLRGVLVVSTETGDEGMFLLPDVPPGRYRLVVSDEYDDLHERRWFGGLEPEASAEIRIKKSRTVRHVELALRSNADITAKARTDAETITLKVDVTIRATGAPAKGDVRLRAGHLDSTISLRKGRAEMTVDRTTSGIRPDRRIRVDYLGNRHTAPAHRKVKQRRKK